MGQNAAADRRAAGHTVYRQRTEEAIEQKREEEKKEKIQTGVQLNDIPQINNKRHGIIFFFCFLYVVHSFSTQSINSLVSLISINCIIIINYSVSGHCSLDATTFGVFRASIITDSMAFAQDVPSSFTKFSVRIHF